MRTTKRRPHMIPDMGLDTREERLSLGKEFTIENKIDATTWQKMIVKAEDWLCRAVKGSDKPWREV